MMKVLEGGWVPLVVAARVFFPMYTVARPQALSARLERDTFPLKASSPRFMKERVSGTAVYLTSRSTVPVPLLHNLKHNKVLHERIVLLHVITENIPRVRPQAASRSSTSRRFPFRRGALRLHGAAQHSAGPDAVRTKNLIFDMMDTSFFVGRVPSWPPSSHLNSFRRRYSTSCIATRCPRRNSSVFRRTG